MGNFSKGKLLYCAQLLLLFFLYYITGTFGLKMEAISGFASLVWPPTGISIAALLILGLDLWPAVMLGAFVVNMGTGANLPSAIGIAIGNTGEAVIAFYLLHHVMNFRRTLERVQDVLALFFFGAILSCMVSATIGVVSLKIFSNPEASFFTMWKTWWFGDFLSTLVITPFLLVLSKAPNKSFLRPFWLLEAILLVGTLSTVSWVIFFFPHLTSNGSFTLIYLTFPILVWAALRFGQHGVVSTSFVITVINVIGTALHGGPFTQGTLNENLFLMESYRCVLTVTGLILAAAVAEKEQAKENMRLAFADLEKRVDARTLELQSITAKLQDEIYVRRKVEADRADLVQKLLQKKSDS